MIVTLDALGKPGASFVFRLVPAHPFVSSIAKRLDGGSPAAAEKTAAVRRVVLDLLPLRRLQTDVSLNDQRAVRPDRHDDLGHDAIHLS